MRLKSTALLIGLLLLLCLGYWLMLQREESIGTRRVDAKRLFAFKGDDVARLSIQQETDPASVGVRADDGAWAIEKPHPIDANQVLWERVAGVFADLMNERTIAESPDDLKAYELDQPRLVVSGAAADGAEHQIAFGALEPYQKDRYALLDNQEVVLIANRSYQELDRNLDWLRQLFLFRNHDEGIMRIEYTRLRERAPELPPPPSDTLIEMAKAEESIMLVMERSDDGTWRLTQPEDCLADQGMVTTFVKEIQFATCRDFNDAPKPLEDYGLDPPGFRITATIGADNDRQTFYIGDSSGKGEYGGVYAKREGDAAIFQLDGGILGSLPETPNAFREKRLLSRSAKDIRRLEFTAGDTHVVLEDIKDTGWQIIEPVREAPDQVALSQFIAALATIRGQGYFTEAMPGFRMNAPLFDIAVTFKDDVAPVHIRAGAVMSDTDRHFALQDTGDLTTLSKSEVDWFKKKDLFFFRAKQIVAFNPEQAQKVTLLFEGDTYTFEMGSRKWKVTQPENAMWDQQGDMALLLKTFSDLQAAGIAADSPGDDPSAYGLDHPVLTFQVAVTPDPEQTQGVNLALVHIGDLTPDNPHERFATVGDRPEIFRIKQTVIDDVREALRGIREL